MELTRRERRHALQPVLVRALVVGGSLSANRKEQLYDMIKERIRATSGATVLPFELDELDKKDFERTLCAAHGLGQIHYSHVVAKVKRGYKHTYGVRRIAA